MSERLNGGPFTLAYGNELYLEYWWGNGDDHQLTSAAAHPTGNATGANFVSYDHRALLETRPNFQEGIAYKYGFTVRNDAHEGDDPTPFDVYAATL